MLERNVFLFGLNINQRGVPLVERAATRILPGQSHRHTLLE